MNHYPRHIGDWMRDTAHLSEIEECMYSRCIDQYYSREKALPLDLAQCARLVRAATAAARKALATVLREFFDEGPDGWHQKRCDEELAKYAEKSTKASESVAVRWSKRNTNVLRTQSVGNTNQEPIATSQVKTKAARKRAISLPPDFQISDRVREWATEKGHTQLGERLEDFISRVKAKGYVYVDWDEAFMNAIRDDWAKLAGRGKATTTAWWASEADTAAKGKELGLEARPGETLNDFRGRIRAAMERHD